MSRNVKVVKVKKEFPDLSEDVVSCRECNKGFASELALGNHVKMSHFELYLSGNPDLWLLPIEKVKTEEEVERRAQELISEMQPTSLTELASQDVSYIIIKTDAPPMKKRKADKEKDKEKAEKGKAAKAPRKEKEVQPITGPFVCQEPSTVSPEGACHQMFFSCCEYSAHFRDEHTRRRRGHRCQVCEKPLGCDTPHACKVCGMCFESDETLSDHAATAHVKLKPFECSVCHKRFTQQGGVQQHMRMHTGDRPFACSFCPKAFTQKSGCDQHMRIHTKVRPYRCVVCCKTFCQSVHLRQHMRIHTNVSPFQCGICNKRFKQSSHLNYHLKYHDPASLTPDQRMQYTALLTMMPGNQGENESAEQEEQQLVYEDTEGDDTQVYEQVETEYQELEYQEMEDDGVYEQKVELDPEEVIIQDDEDNTYVITTSR